VFYNYIGFQSSEGSSSALEAQLSKVLAVFIAFLTCHLFERRHDLIRIHICINVVLGLVDDSRNAEAHIRDIILHAFEEVGNNMLSDLVL